MVDKAGGGFSIDDIELATLLAGIAGAALADGAPVAAPPDPAELGAALAALARSEPLRYAAVARVLSVLLDHG